MAALEALGKAVLGNDTKLALQLAEEFELECDVTASAETTSLFYKVHLVCLMINNDLPSSRLLWKRIPRTFKDSDAELVRIWRVGAALIKQEFGPAFTELLGAPWSDGVKSLITELIACIRARNLALIAKAYTAISVADCAVKLGMTHSDCLTAVTEAGWKQIDAHAVAPERTAKSTSIVDGADRMSQLTNHVVALGAK